MKAPETRFPVRLECAPSQIQRVEARGEMDGRVVPSWPLR